MKSKYIELLTLWHETFAKIRVPLNGSVSTEDVDECAIELFNAIGKHGQKGARLTNLLVGYPKAAPRMAIRALIQNRVENHSIKSLTDGNIDYGLRICTASGAETYGYYKPYIEAAANNDLIKHYLIHEFKFPNGKVIPLQLVAEATFPNIVTTAVDFSHLNKISEVAVFTQAISNKYNLMYHGHNNVYWKNLRLCLHSMGRDYVTIGATNATTSSVPNMVRLEALDDSGNEVIQEALPYLKLATGHYRVVKGSNKFIIRMSFITGAGNYTSTYGVLEYDGDEPRLHVDKDMLDTHYMGGGHFSTERPVKKA